VPFTAVTTIDEVFHEVEAGVVRFGVAPSRIRARARSTIPYS